MVAISLDKPGRRYLHTKTRFYRVYGHPHGCLELERASDGASAFFQGDDAGILEDEIERASPRMLNAVLDQYGGILQTES